VILPSFDLDQLGAKFGEQSRREWRRNQRPELDDAQAR
jgi:hypothetical protein